MRGAVPYSPVVNRVRPELKVVGGHRNVGKSAGAADGSQVGNIFVPEIRESRVIAHIHEPAVAGILPVQNNSDAWTVILRNRKIGRR